MRELTQAEKAARYDYLVNDSYLSINHRLVMYEADIARHNSGEVKMSKTNYLITCNLRNLCVALLGTAEAADEHFKETKENKQ